jgi:hypothetical protein
VIPKIGVRLTFQPLSVFLNLESAIIAAIIITTRILILVGEDTYYQEVSRGVNNNHFIRYHTFDIITAYSGMMPRH